jgi:hypothetical protein
VIRIYLAPGFELHQALTERATHIVVIASLLRLVFYIPVAIHRLAQQAGNDTQPEVLVPDVQLNRFGVGKYILEFGSPFFFVTIVTGHRVIVIKFYFLRKRQAGKQQHNGCKSFLQVQQGKHNYCFMTTVSITLASPVAI